MSLVPMVSVLDENESFDLDLDDLDDLADAVGELFLEDFFLLAFLGGFGMSGYGVASWPLFSGSIPYGDISRGWSKSAKSKKSEGKYRSVTGGSYKCLL